MGRKNRAIAFYGKGGIGKSTMVSNVAAALAEDGRRVLVVGCDPKSDCTRNLRGDVVMPTVTKILLEKTSAPLELSEFVSGKEIKAEDIVYEGFMGIACIEVGGPEPGVGCAGRGVSLAIDLINRIVLDKLEPDVIFYDILGDIVCGGFGMNLRKGFADQVCIVTSSDYLAVFAANNICKGIYRYADRSGTPLGGLIYNVRGLLDDISLVEEFADEIGSRIIGDMKNSRSIMESEIYAQTVIEREPESSTADAFRALAKKISNNTKCVSPRPLTDDKLAELAQKIRERTRLKHEEIAERST
jgi:nitrogenase iron protein NifH